MPLAPHDRPSRPTPPRGLIFLASGWLVASWLLSIGWRPPVQAHAASYAPGVRAMLLALVIGIGVGWPLVRLSGPARAWPIRQALLDLAVLACLAQVVVWPLRLVTPWPPSRSAALDVCLAGWSLATAATVVIGTIPAERGRRVARFGAMIAALLLLLAGPIATIVDGAHLPFDSQVHSDQDPWWWSDTAHSPLTAIHALAAPNPQHPSAVEWDAARFGLLVAAVAWGAALVLRVPLMRGRPRANHGRAGERGADAPPAEAVAREPEPGAADAGGSR